MARYWRLPNMLLIKAYVGKSKVHGNGLFATEDIAEGTELYCFDPSIDRKVDVADAKGDDLHFGYISPVDGKLIICGDDARWWNFGWPMPPNCVESHANLRHGEGVLYSCSHIRAGDELLVSMETDLDAQRKLML